MKLKNVKSQHKKSASPEKKLNEFTEYLKMKQR